MIYIWWVVYLSILWVVGFKMYLFLVYELWNLFDYWVHNICVMREVWRTFQYSMCIYMYDWKVLWLSVVFWFICFVQVLHSLTCILITTWFGCYCSSLLPCLRLSVFLLVDCRHVTAGLMRCVDLWVMWWEKVVRKYGRKVCWNLCVGYKSIISWHLSPSFTCQRLIWLRADEWHYSEVGH